METFASELSLGNFRLGLVAWVFSFEISRLRCFVWNPSLVNFRFGNQAPEAGGTGLLRLGEPSGQGRGNHRAVAAFTVFLEKPSENLSR